MRADDWRNREAALADALDRLAQQPATEPFFDRPLPRSEVLGGPLLESITDPLLTGRGPIGTVEQWSDNVALLVDSERRLAATRALFGPGWLRKAR